ncbi:MAG: AMP-binding protein, partial [Elusimicrobia bacterium]|nr:AMP-binding protein [Elusimicrobiota bacterium]
ASYMIKEEYPEDTKIGLLSENSVYWPAVYFASQLLGMTIVTLDTQMKPRDNIHYLRHSGAGILFTSSDVYESMDLDLAKGLKIKETILLDSPSFNGASSLEEILEGVKPANVRDLNIDKIGKDSTAALLYTSGTTGSPKGVVLTHANILHQAEMIPEIVTFTPEDVFYGVLPLFHTLPTVASLIAPFISGASVVFPKTIRATTLVKIMKDRGVTVMVGVPALYESLKKAMVNQISHSSILVKSVFGTLKGITKVLNVTGMNAGRVTFSAIRSKVGMKDVYMMISGGAPLMTETADFFNLLGIEFFEGYGLTETSPVLTVNYKGKKGSVGKAVINVDIRISDPDENGIGMIEVRGPNIMKEYYRNTEATDEIFLGDGWLSTGDLGYVDSDGYLFLKGRNKNVIVSSAGKNIYPEEVEDKVRRSNFILECMVYGRRESESNQAQTVEALIYPDFETIDAHFREEGIEETDEAIYALINEEVKRLTKNLPNYKKIRKFRIHREDFEKTSTRKIKRFLYAD